MIPECTNRPTSTSTSSTSSIDAPAPATCDGGEADAVETLPRPLSPATGDDLMTALAMLTIQQRHEQRIAADQQRAAASKAQEAANADKIGKMRELADDTFMEGVVSGALTGAAAAASAVSACDGYAAATTECQRESAELTRDAKLMSAGTSTQFADQVGGTKESPMQA